MTFVPLLTECILVTVASRLPWPYSPSIEHKKVNKHNKITVLPVQFNQVFNNTHYTPVLHAILFQHLFE